VVALAQAARCRGESRAGAAHHRCGPAQGRDADAAGDLGAAAELHSEPVLPNDTAARLVRPAIEGMR
jgi:hypothetical protein